MTITDADIRLLRQMQRNGGKKPAPPRRRFVTQEWIAANLLPLITEDLPSQAGAVFDTLWREIEALKERAAIAEAKLAEIEERGEVAYRGVWVHDTEYRRGNLVTDHGAMWVCLADTRERPGGGAAWKLAVKSADPERRTTRSHR
jgi:hypothetical protein